MTDYTQLKRLAEALLASDDHADFPGWMAASDAFDNATGPAAVLSLIAENDLLRGAHEQICTSYNQVSYASEERGKQIDQLKAELEHNGYDHDLLRNENDQLKAENEALRKDSERLQSATAFVQKLCDAAVKQPSVATGYLHDILSAMGKEEQS